MYINVYCANKAYLQLKNIVYSYRTGFSSDQKDIDVCRTRNQLERRKFVINNELYCHFYNAL